MSLRNIVWPLAVFLIVGVLTHLMVLGQQPRQATDRTLAAIRERGAVWNHYSVGKVRDAKTNVVVRDNPDTITGFAMLDLAEGPALFTLPAPTEPLYWSVSVYGRNTDTLGVVRDDEGLDVVRIAIARPGQTTPAGYRRLETREKVAVMIVRAVLRDRKDTSHVEAIRSELLEAELQMVAGDGGAP